MELCDGTRAGRMDGLSGISAACFQHRSADPARGVGAGVNHSAAGVARATRWSPVHPACPCRCLSNHNITDARQDRAAIDERLKRGEILGWSKLEITPPSISNHLCYGTLFSLPSHSFISLFNLSVASLRVQPVHKDLCSQVYDSGETVPAPKTQYQSFSARAPRMAMPLRRQES
jgi:hypothetical protein